MEGNLIGPAMVYIYLLAVSAGMGLLTAAAVGFKLRGWYLARQTAKTPKMRRRGA